jgi:hypothetical protein
MSPDTEAKLERVRKYSTGLRKLFNFFRVIITIASFFALLIVLTRGTSEASASFAVFDREFTGDEITWTLKTLVVLWVLIVFGVAQKFLRHLATLFDLYSQGQIFTADNVYQIRQIGITVFLFCAGGFFSAIAKLVLLALGRPLGSSPQAPDTIGLGLDGPLWAILGGIIIVVISWIMDVGREMREEADLTV